MSYTVLQFKRCTSISSKWHFHKKSLWYFSNLLVTFLGITKRDMKYMGRLVRVLLSFSLWQMLFLPRVQPPFEPLLNWIPHHTRLKTCSQRQPKRDGGGVLALHPNNDMPKCPNLPLHQSRSILLFLQLTFNSDTSSKHSWPISNLNIHLPFSLM